MRKITRDAYDAFQAKKRFKKDNTEVKVFNGESHLYLFGNEIVKTDKGDVWISDGRYRPSKTTSERLSAFVYIRVNNGHFIINNQLRWDGRWLNISKL